MLSEEEYREVGAVIAESEAPRAACLEALRVVQKHRRWVSDAALRDLAPVLGMTPAELDAIATFYPLVYRRPVGRHVIHLCDSVSCWIMGYETLLAHLTARLGIAFGQTSPDGRFTLLPIACLGACDRAPVLMIDGELHGELTPEKIDHLLEAYP